MSQDHTAFPNITLVAKMIYLDNGKIDRIHGEESFLEDLDNILGADGVDYSDLQELENWLASLTTAEKDTLASGEQSEMEEIQNKAPNPELCAGLFEDVFNA